MLSKSQSQIYCKNNPRVTELVVNYGFTTMQKTFGQQLREKMAEMNIKAAELSRLSGVTKQNIGRLLNETPHPITGAVPTTTKETVVKIAPYVNWDLNEALLAAGHAPMPIDNKENTYSKLPIAGFDGLDDDDVREMVEFMNFRRAKKGLPPIEPDK